MVTFSFRDFCVACFILPISGILVDSILRYSVLIGFEGEPFLLTCHNHNSDSLGETVINSILVDNITLRRISETNPAYPYCASPWGLVENGTKSSTPLCEFMIFPPQTRFLFVITFLKNLVIHATRKSKNYSQLLSFTVSLNSLLQARRRVICEKLYSRQLHLMLRLWHIDPRN